jgi:heme o synthase
VQFVANHPNFMIKVEKASFGNAIRQKLTDIGILMKFKLSLTVVFSAVMAFLIALKTPLNGWEFAILFLGGFFVTGAANALNQVLEKDYDRLMKRTENRPLSAGRMNSSEAVLIAGLSALIGISFLALFNPLSAFLGMISLISYSFVYTPMKRVSNVAVTIGAIPGALPMVIGCTAAENGTLSILALTLFGLQFFWQFPHFWAIAWLADEDYKNAGFKLLPSKDGEKNENVGFQSFIYALFLIPLSWVTFAFGITGLISALILTIVAILYAYYGWRLYKECTREAARKLMFCSFFYLPVMLFALYFDKI